MPETIVPEAELVRALAMQLGATRQSISQASCHLPKHFPSAQVEQLINAALLLTCEAEHLARLVARYEDQQAAQAARECAWLEDDDLAQDARHAWQSDAAEHQTPGAFA